jgi:hypothetical protein
MKNKMAIIGIGLMLAGCSVNHYEKRSAELATPGYADLPFYRP